jgi:ABC-type lipoprotein export system ATPase subunit
MGCTLIEIRQLEFAYPRAEFRLTIDQLTIESGSRVAIVGPSGSGKTTLLHLISGIAVPRGGTIDVAGKRVTGLNDRQRRDFRAASIGFIFQQFELVEYLSVLDNIVLPLMINRSLRIDASVRQRAVELARTVGLQDKLSRNVRRLSQGEQQRVAICRALITEPPLVLADEPTGNLDPRNKSMTIQLLFEFCQRQRATLLVVTHDHGILQGFDRQIDFEQFRQESVP